jgi:hypothetical protein
MTWPHGETVTRLRAHPVPDPYSGDTVLSWETPDELPIQGAAVAPVQAAPTESRNAVGETRSAVSSGFTVYLPTGSDVTARDRIRVRGKVYRVAGEPADWRSPWTGWAPGLVIICDRVEG